MKCNYCKQEIDPKKIAYWRGKKVHPDCFDKLKWKENHLSHEEWIELVKKRFEKLRNEK